MKKYLITAMSCSEENAILISAGSIDEAVQMLRSGDVDLSGVLNRDCQFENFDITKEMHNEYFISFRRFNIDYFKKDFSEEDLASVEALITIYDWYFE